MNDSHVVTDVGQVLRRRGDIWEVAAAEHPTLELFLYDGGDYKFWITADGRESDIFDCSGGNCVNWELVDHDTIELSFQFGSPGYPPARIKLEVLWEAIECLAGSRRDRERIRESEVAWDRHHAAWLADKGSCPADTTRRNCSDRTHEQWERDKPFRQRRKS
jgi:hypothetical protein